MVLDSNSLDSVVDDSEVGEDSEDSVVSVVLNSVDTLVLNSVVYPVLPSDVSDVLISVDENPKLVVESVDSPSVEIVLVSLSVVCEDSLSLVLDSVVTDSSLVDSPVDTSVDVSSVREPASNINLSKVRR